MKRCPIDQGGCGKLAEFLFDSGLCSSCDAAVKRGTAAAGKVVVPDPPRNPTPFEPGAVGATDGRQVKRRGPGRVKREPKTDDGLCVKGCGKPRHRGHCAKPKAEAKPKRAYARRQPVTKAPGFDDTSIEAKMREMRQASVDEIEQYEKRIYALGLSLRILDDLFAQLKLKP